MKPQLPLFGFALCLLAGCREENSAGKATPSFIEKDPIEERPAVKTEVNKARSSIGNAKSEIAKPEDAIEMLRGEERMLRSDLRVLEDQRRDLEMRISALNEEKAKVAEEIAAFQKKWDVEAEGFEEGIDSPLIEVYRELLEGRENARKENKELKEKLNAYEAAAGTR